MRDKGTCSSLVTTASSRSSVEYIHRLESEIIELKEARVRDEEERAREQEARAKQDEVQKNILNFLRSKGYDDASYLRGWFIFKLKHLLFSTLSSS